MKYLCLAYGDEAGWKSLTDDEQKEVLAHDAVIRSRGNFMTAVMPTVTTVKNWNKKLEILKNADTQDHLPLAGFSIIEADTLEQVIELVSNTPCARAKGYINILPLQDLDNP